jgi:hypothetical protein
MIVEYQQALQRSGFQHGLPRYLMYTGVTGGKRLAVKRSDSRSGEGR